MNKGLTVKQLLKACIEQVSLGNGDKHIVISSDDEGNSYHTLFYLFSEVEEGTEALFHDGNIPEETIILG